MVRGRKRGGGELVQIGEERREEEEREGTNEVESPGK